MHGLCDMHGLGWNGMGWMDEMGAVVLFSLLPHPLRHSRTSPKTVVEAFETGKDSVWIELDGIRMDWIAFVLHPSSHFRY